MFSMISAERERGLSEIVGFILILATIVIAFVLYATYGIPSQGRDGEIAHMNEVRDRFVEYKVNIDSLWSNRQCGTAIGTSFTLGTGGGSTTGFFSVIPILSPVKTSATLALNQRAEYISISQDSLFIVNSGQSMNDFGFIGTSPSTITFNMTPRYFFINLTTSDLLQRHGVHIYPTTGSTWDAWVNVTPFYSWSKHFNVTNDTPTHIINFYEENVSLWNRTDITVTTKNGGISVIQDFIVFKNVTPTPSTYVVDLMNPVYGISTNLGSTIAPQTITVMKSDSSITASFITNYSYWPSVYTENWNMGSLEYRAQNEYWIPQTYYYQMGGVFLEQNDGNMVKVPPAITFSLANGTTPAVNINEIILLGSGVIQGSGPGQVTSTVTGITDTPLVSGNNTRFVNISIWAQSNNAAMMWNRTLLDSANKAGFLPGWYTMNTAGVVTYMNISSGSAYGIQLSLRRVTVSATIQTATGT